MQTNGVEAHFDNIKVTLPEAYVENTLVYYPYPTVYEPETNLVLPPSVITPVYNETSLTAIQAEVRPQTVMFKIDEQLNVLDEQGNSFKTVTEVLEAIKGKVIPAFYIEDEVTGTNLAKLLEEQKVKDVFVISNTLEAVIKAREEYNMIRGIIQFDYDENKPSLSKDDLLDIRKKTNESKAIVALLPKEYITKDNVSYLQKRLVTVWSDTYQGTISDQYNAILSGVNGIVTDEFNEIFDLYKEFPENAVIRKPFIIAHRGMPTLAPENTIEGAQLAFSKGADIVELDLHYTKDREVVVFHDFTTARMTSQDLKILDSTLAELKALNLKDPAGNETEIKIPTLREFLDPFKTDEDAMFFIEIKNYDISIVNDVKTILEELNMQDRAAVISFQTSQIEKMNEVMPEISNGLLDYQLMSNDINASLSSVLNAIAPINTTINPSYTYMNYDFVRIMSHRGITVWPWTISTEIHEWNDFYFMGSGGITTDNGDYLESTWNDFKMNAHTLEYVIGETINVGLKGKIFRGDGQIYDFVPTFQIIDDDGTAVEINEQGMVTSAQNEGTASILVSYTSLLPDGTSYVLYDGIVTIDVKTPVIDDEIDDDSDDDVNEEPDEEEDSNLYLYLGIAIGIFVVIGSISFVLLRKRK